MLLGTKDNLIGHTIKHFLFLLFCNLFEVVFYISERSLHKTQ